MQYESEFFAIFCQILNSNQCILAENEIKLYWNNIFSIWHIQNKSKFIAIFFEIWNEDFRIDRNCRKTNETDVLYLEYRRFICILLQLGAKTVQFSVQL